LDSCDGPSDAGLASPASPLDGGDDAIAVEALRRRVAELEHALEAGLASQPTRQIRADTDPDLHAVAQEMQDGSQPAPTLVVGAETQAPANDWLAQSMAVALEGNTVGLAEPPGERPAETAPRAEVAPAVQPADECRRPRLAARHAPPPTPAPRGRPGGPVPAIPGIRIQGLVSGSPGCRTFVGREDATHRAVLVKVFDTGTPHLDGRRLEKALLAQHPNLVAVLAFAACDQGPYLVVERALGETVSELVRRAGRQDERTAVCVMLEAARALRHAAQHGVSHGALTPDDVVMDVSGRVRVSGVGLAGVAESRCSPGPFGDPERLRDDTPNEVLSDIWSLGAVAWFLLAGAPPPADGPGHVVSPTTKQWLRGIRALRPEVSEETASLLSRMLSRRLSMRPQGWDQLLVELERCVTGRAPAQAAPTPADAVRRFTLKNPWVLAIAVLLPLGVAFLWRGKFGRDPTAAERYADAVAIAERLVASGDIDSAKLIYRRFLSATGDPAVERAAAARFDELSKPWRK
jgi:hypothetical protein